MNISTKQHIVECNCQDISSVPNIPSMYPLLLDVKAQKEVLYIFSISQWVFRYGLPQID